jgi:hypothetical protein
VLLEGFSADEDFIEKYRDRIRFLINVANSDWNDSATGKSIHASTNGYTQYLPTWKMSRITLASQMVGPLLRNDISDSQRLVLQFQCAKTVSRKNPSHAMRLTYQLDHA